jgi:DNA topoisomerase-3
MKVCIAEKPSVAREIATILGADSRRDGYFEGNGYQVTWTFGHLCTLKEPHDYHTKWKPWLLFTMPILPEKHETKLITNNGVEKQFNTIAKLVQGCDEVINCGDAGQEGELIQRWVLEMAECKVPVQRLWISSLTDEAIREGFQNLKSGTQFDRLFAAGKARAIGDWLLGMNATRLYTLKYGNNKGVLSIGRVQTPTLAMIVNRQLEIEDFKSEPFWELKTTYRETVFSATSGRFLKKEEAEAAMEKVKGTDFTITSFTKKQGKEHPPKLFDLTSIQVEANKKFGASAEETLRHVQSMYEKKMVTYPRTDSSYLSNDLYPKIPGILKQMQPYAKYAEPLLQAKLRKSKKVFDDAKVTDHHAIIPTGVFPHGLNEMEKKIYDAIARRFLAAFHPDCEVSNTTVLGEAAKIEFKAMGKQILSPGWRILYSKGADASKDGEEQLMPVFEKGETGPHKIDLAEKETMPPKYFTEATLLRAMETAGKAVDDEELRDLMKENGIGRPSTRANIIETLFKRKYMERERKRIVATSTGVQLIKTIQNELLKSAELTGQWERKLRQIELGEYEPTKFMDEMSEMVTNMVEDIRSRPDKVIEIVSEEDKAAHEAAAKAKAEAEKRANIKCPKCKEGKIIRGKTALGCSRWKDGCDFKVNFTYGGKTLTKKHLMALFEKGKTPPLKGLQSGENKFDGHLEISEAGDVKFIVKEEDSYTCPKCKTGTIMDGKTAYGCSDWQAGCDFKLPFILYGKKLTQTQVKQLFTKGKTSKIKGFVRPDGSKGDAKLVLGENAEITFEK